MRLTEEVKEKMLQPCKSLGYHFEHTSEENCIKCSSFHIKEFGFSVGKVVKICEYGDLEVNWIPTNLRYRYIAEHLQICNLKVFV